ncbi:hypothetical protein F5B22DRAFT_650639 [Xylaria bambusicola]|uniref:uncharacterized protein n=1 Tax=Xylaria bambusicola TaxID=326684 RepID=UPI00200808B1|nr:uncharacterized protein F5B22DRAFT_650639 [Xylaria bambusicola]KAI0506527.1 hypothetical protein F5B22DRAFT_650639 [Xylaria bambusicola]
MIEPRLVPVYEDGLERAYPYNSALGSSEGQEMKSDRLHVGPSAKKKGYLNIIRGMPLSTLILAITLIILIIAAGIGAGIGASIGAKGSNQSCSSAATVPSPATSSPDPASSANATATSSGVYTVETNVLLPLDCPGLDSTPQTSTFAHRTSTFQMYCRNAYTYDSNKAILSIVVYTLHDCLQACVSFNHYVNADNCTAAMFFSNLTSTLPESGANCFMATDTDVSSLEPSEEGNNLVTALIN